jgi:catalase
LKDADAFWDFISLRPETTHQVSFLFSDRGIPNGYRHMDGFGSHTFKFVNAKGESHYVKFHLKTNQGIKNLPVDVANRISAEDPDYSIKDLFDHIAKGQFPSWEVKIQIMTFEQAEKFRWNPFDLTKIWPHGEFPLIPVGRLVLNQNPKNYFAEVEQIAFSPAHMVPGIEPSPDKMLHGRLFSYSDTHRHRLGANYQQLPVNCPFAKTKNYQRDGPATFDNQEGAPNYFPNSFHGPHDDKKYAQHKFSVSADVQRYNTADDDNFTQVGDFWRKVLKPEERERLAQNIAGNLKNAKPFIQKRAIANFAKADPEYGRKIEEYIQKANQSARL